MRYFIFFTLLIISACKPQTPTTIGEKDPLPEQPLQLTDSLILVMIFGKAEKLPSAPKGSFFATIQLDSSQFSPEHWKSFGRSGSTDYYVEMKKKITEDSVEKYLVVLGGTGIGCHVCPGVCGAAIFSKLNNSWKLEVWENDIVVFGSSGYPVDQVDIRYVKKDAYAIILKEGSLWQGVSYRSMDMILYEKGTFKEVLEAPVCFSSDNWANAEDDYPYRIAQKAYSYTASIEFEPNKSDYWDMVLHYQGTILNLKTHKTEFLEKPIRFEYRNGKYVALGKIPKPY